MIFIELVKHFVQILYFQLKVCQLNFSTTMVYGYSNIFICQLNIVDIFVNKYIKSV